MSTYSTDTCFVEQIIVEGRRLGKQGYKTESNKALTEHGLLVCQSTSSSAMTLVQTQPGLLLASACWQACVHYIHLLIDA